MAQTIIVKRTVEEEHECEVFTFPTEKDRKEFIKDLRAHDSEYPYATNMDPDKSAPERYLVAVPIERFNFVTQGDD
jgi:hypothetical protein